MMSPSAWGDELDELPDSVDWLEVRADLADEPGPDWIRSNFNGKLLYSLRSREEGGNFEGSLEDRRNRLLRAARSYDLVDLEAERDLIPQLLTAIPANKRLISWSGQFTESSALLERFKRMTSAGARIYKLVSRASRSGEGLAPLAFLRSAKRTDVVAFASGDAGLWSRVLAPHLGAPLVFGAVGNSGSAFGEPSILKLTRDYGLPELPQANALYGIVGSPITHSLSPRLHNAAYRALGFPGLFLPFHEESFTDFWREMIEEQRLEGIGPSVRGLTVASPHKEAALPLAAQSSEMVQQAGATNLFVRNGRGWKADTTDPEGAVVALRERGVEIRNQKAAVIGCGGAGRAVAAALSKHGADVTLVNRSAGRGLKAKELLGLPFVRLSEFSADDYSTLVNATPVGRNGETLPFDVTRMSQHGTVVDLAYGAEPTPLINDAVSQQLNAVDGLEVLLIQVRHQFRLMTGIEMPLDVARESLGFRTRGVAAAD
jgi:3-dehydroquinate dehydratase/shikimate dehydrogenase